MSIKNTLHIIFSILLTTSAYAQNKRDIVIKEKILPVLNSGYEDKAAYNTVKAEVSLLEKGYGHEVLLKRRLLEPAYYHNDINYFKNELTVLVKNHGFDAAYLTGNENYFNAIMKGNLASWFKEMYLKNHTIWLTNNFDKQADLRKLNTINEKDQYITAFAMKVLNIPGIDSLQQETIKNYLAEYHFKNIEPILTIATKWGVYAGDKSFACIQNGFDTTLIHNFQFEKNQREVWEALFPSIKKAYLNNEITDVIFRNYDFYHYLHFGSQVFNSFTLQQMPEQFRKTQTGPIPIKDTKWLEQIKKEFKWND
ncbi:hypothetical protein FMM05_01535 [Flavobacterium zepuense]|uniref:Uncharacterized protein n=1 Tax=Flavobacterium zepuense TaxID=2593302 RepID=A0A552VA35_9FLAO|nr:hypothetical protein [Flavobacterium zepuense]TRW27348.1 hypothetical protein FMM05_01535 [Flavobacterium zepuense]